MYRSSYKHLSKKVLLIVLSACLTVVAGYAQEVTIPTHQSNLTGASLPSGASRIVDASVPTEINDALEKLVASGNGKVRQGESEVLAWAKGFKRSQAPGLVEQVTGNLKRSGWEYEVGGENGGVTVFSLLRSEPSKRAVLGFYTFSDEALVFAWTELLVNDAPPVAAVNSDTRSPHAGLAANVFNVEKNADQVNVMGSQMPAMPKFPALMPKPGKVRGYVKDAGGKPLAGAAIGVRSTLIGGAYSGAQGKTDVNGYYEFTVPSGVAHYYNAGYAIDYGDGLAAIGLHAADGSVDSFASVDGAVENFVLLPYGITSRVNLQENPRLPSTYYGGSIYIGHWVVEASDAASQPKSIVENSVIEITVTPDGLLADGSAGRAFVIRKTAATFQTGFYINNIPIGRYKISGKLNGKPLKLRLNKPVGSMFGMTPTETTGEATILFSPGSANASMVTPNFGAWNAVEIIVERPK